MPVNRQAYVETVLASAVADDGTFDVAYPTGTTQLSFTAGLAGASHYVMLNDNEKWTAADPGIAVSFGASAITITNQSGYSWPAGTKVLAAFDQVDGNQVAWLTFPVKLAKLANGDIVTEIRLGVWGTIEHWSFTVTDPATTAAKAATLNLEIDTTNVTGGTIALTSANCTPLGKNTAAAAITGANTLTPDSKLSVEASSVTTFVEGEGFISIRIRLDQSKNW
jgi:hypothetical protein